MTLQYASSFEKQETKNYLNVRGCPGDCSEASIK